MEFVIILNSVTFLFKKKKIIFFSFNIDQWFSAKFEQSSCSTRLRVYTHLPIPGTLGNV